MASETQVVPPAAPAPPGKKAGPNKRLLVAIAVLVVAGIAAKFFIFNKPFRYAGTLEATKVDLSARLSSTLLKVNVQEGDHVSVGQELIQFLCDDVKVTSDLANLNFSRNEKLFKAGTVSNEAMDQVRNRKDEADVHMSWCTIRAPLVATVLSRYHEPGEWVTPGTKLLTLANVKDIWAYIYVPEPLIAKLKPGLELTSYLPELGDQKFIGKIVKINSEAEFTPKNVQTQSERSRLVFGVKVSFSGVNGDEILKPGMTVEVEWPKELK